MQFSLPLLAAARPSNGQLGLLALFALGIPASIALLWAVSAVAQRRRGLQPGEYGPMKWLFVFASGAKPDILRECPEEEPKYVGLGGAVLVTTTMAAVSSTVALTIATGAAWWMLWPIGLMYGGIIFLLDRFLVSQQLNPYRFERESLPEWWRRDADPRVGADGAAGTARRRRLRNVGRVPAVLLAALPRLALAAVIGILIAEPMVLKIFEPEVDDKIASIQREIRDRDVAEINAYYDAEIARIAGEEVASAGGLDMSAIDNANADLDAARAELQAIEARLATAEDAVKANEVNVAELQTLLAAEIRGETLCRANGSDCTTGIAGDAQNAAHRRDEIATAELMLADARVQRDAIAAERTVKQGEINNELLPAIEFARNASQSTLDAEQSRQQNAADDRQRRIDAKTAEREEAIAAATIDAAEADGLLYRVEALESITRGDPFRSFDPATGAVAEGDGNLNALGLTVWLLRIWILLIDTMPILFKIALSLRSRRPYDALVAAREEASIAKAYAQVDTAYDALRATRWAGVQGDPSLQLDKVDITPRALVE
ncbi:MAG TPA: DUF4407 domain-containing protein [Ilumatobacter sp.]|nr:DUF4407 domain-containing protein [Ilumatobacter sp.]